MAYSTAYSNVRNDTVPDKALKPFSRTVTENQKRTCYI